MEDDFLIDYLIIYNEKEIAGNFKVDSICEEFSFMKQY